MEVVDNMMAVSKYPAYRDSGVEWLGDVPKHWGMIPNKFIYKLKKNLVGKNSDKYTLLSLTLHGIVKRDMDNPQGKFPAEFDTYQEVQDGDFVFCLFDVEETPRCVGLSAFNGMITGAYTVLSTTPEFERKYLYYFYLNLDNAKRLRPLYTGLRNTISKDRFFAFKTFIPPLQEQKSVAAFLDDKTSKIDRAIAQKERMIELLKERKQIIIQNAVTKGLDPNVKMKDSGVDWIGEIPEHWEVKRLRNIFRFSKGLTITKENLQDEGVFCVNYGEIHSKYGFEVNPDIHPLKCVSEEYLNDNLNSLIKKGDFIFADTSEDLEGSGNFTYLNYDQPIFAGYHTIIARPIIDPIPRFLAYVLDSASFRNQVRTRMKGVKVYSITQSTLKDLTCWYPATNEQEDIVKYLDKSCSRLEEVIKLEKSQIVKLKELKSTLVDSAVTGKIRVC